MDDVDRNIKSLKSNAYTMAKMLCQSNAGQRKETTDNIFWGDINGIPNPLIDMCIYAMACDTAKIIESGLLHKINLNRSRKLLNMREFQKYGFNPRKDETVKLVHNFIDKGYAFDLEVLESLLDKWRTDRSKVLNEMAEEGFALVFSGKLDDNRYDFEGENEDENYRSEC